MTLRNTIVVLIIGYLCDLTINAAWIARHIRTLINSVQGAPLVKVYLCHLSAHHGWRLMNF